MWMKSMIKCLQTSVDILIDGFTTINRDQRHVAH